jgi:hypothetical protein
LTSQKNKSRDFPELIDAGFMELVGYQTKGQLKKMPRLELMVFQKIRGAIQGDPSCIKFLLKHINRRAPKIVPNPITSESEEPDGSLLRKYHDGREEIIWPDGSRQMNYPDGRIQAIDEKGIVTWTSEEEIETLGNPTTLEELKLRRGF